MTDVAGWRHVWKLDPDKTLPDCDLQALCAAGSDAIVVGGTQGVTYGATESLLRRARSLSDAPIALEVSEPEAVVDGFDRYFIPVVLNAADPQWIVGRHMQAIRRFSDLVPWDKVVPVAYLVLNPASAVARKTAALTEMADEEAEAYAVLAERLYRMPIVYAEYSGVFGSMRRVAAMRRALGEARLFYGGGIAGPEQAASAAGAADTIVVGNAIYEQLQSALATVGAVKTRNRR